MSNVRLTEQGVIAVIRHDAADVAVAVACACIRSGLTAVELTATTPAIADATADVAAVARAASALLGVGTVRDATTAEAVIAAGAAFVVSPDYVAAVHDVAAAAGVPYLPGALTPTEVGRLADLGLPLVKLFPVGNLGLGGLAALRDIFPHTGFVVTGGVQPGDAGDWIRAGARAVGIGSSLVRTYLDGGETALSVVLAAARHDVSAARTTIGAQLCS